MGEFVIGLGIGAVVAGLLSSCMYFVLFYKDDKSNHHLPETKVNIPMPELRPCQSCRNYHSHHGVCDICKDFSCWTQIETLENDKPSGKWENINNTLPIVGMNVLVCDEDGDIYLTHRSYGGVFFNEYGDKIKDIRAWMPLPKPYVVEKQGENT